MNREKPLFAVAVCDVDTSVGLIAPKTCGAALRLSPRDLAKGRLGTVNLDKAA
jgi:hypothetical protein